MTEDQIQLAVESLYDNEALTNELSDEEAQLLLSWGERQISALGARIDDETVFDDQCVLLRRVMTRLNHFVGTRADMDEDEQQNALDAVMAAAQAVGFTPDPAQTTGFLNSQSGLNNVKAMQQLLDLLDGKAAPTPPTPSAPPDAPTTQAQNLVSSALDTLRQLFTPPPVEDDSPPNNAE